MASVIKKINGQKIGYLTGLILVSAFVPLLFLPTLRGKYLPIFLLCFSLAGAAYLVSVIRINRVAIPLHLIWIVAILVRLILLGTNPSLSDDVYRYLWDGHLLHRNINPYSEAVNSSRLDPFTTTFREKVNHPDMASPYLPVAQAYFWLVEWLAPQQVKAYQVGAVLLDLLTALFIQKLLVRLKLKPASVLLYLWNPLVIIEFAHAAHVDALMVFLIMFAWYVFLTEEKKRPLSALILALATLTKGLPVILVPLWIRKWRIRGLIIYLSIITITITIFALGAGWGLSSLMDGRGLFGAIRIYTQYWEFDSGIFYWLSGRLSATINSAARILAALITLAILILSGRKAWELTLVKSEKSASGRAILRLSLLPLGAFLLLLPTLHPWYLTLIIPLLPFFIPAEDDSPKLWTWIVPWIYFSLVVVYSYLAYFNSTITKIPEWVVWIEYLPFYAGLVWAAEVNRKQIKAK